jgi:hypothetical protein
MKRELCEGDWLRFDHYAVLVRGINMSTRIEGPFSVLFQHGLRRLRQVSTSASLIPSLRWLRCFVRQEEDIRSLCCFVSPFLRTLSVYLSNGIPAESWHPSDILCMFEEIRFLGPSIIDLTLLHLVQDPRAEVVAILAIAASLRTLLESQTELQSLSIDQALLRTMIGMQHPILPQLSTLQLSSNGGMTKLNPYMSCPTSTPFPGLRKIGGSLGNVGVALWISLLPVVGHSLTELRLEEPGIAEEPARSVLIRQLFDVIASSCRSLQSLAITHDCDSDALQSLSGFHRALRLCSELVTLKIRIGRQFDICWTLTDQDILDLTTFWPKIEVLELGAHIVERVGIGHRPPLSLYSINVLCARLPRLQYLMLTVDTEPCCSTTPTLPPNSLDKLHFGYSTIGNTSDIARWIGNVCPAKNIYRNRDSMSNQWNVLVQVIKSSQAAAAALREKDVVHSEARIAQSE